MLKGFKDFVLRGNVVDLATAVVVGAAFTAVVNAVANDLVGGLVSAIGEKPNADRLFVTLNGAHVVYGTTITAVVNFLIVAAVVYFLVLVPVNRLLALRGQDEEPEVVATPEDIKLLQEIRDLLREQRAGARGEGSRAD